MTDLTPAQLAALAHWSSFGRPGEPVDSRYVPEGYERERFKEFVQPASAAWRDEFDDAQTQSLLRGFPRGEMEDKWIVYSDDLSASGTTAVHFHRSWTGAQIVQVELQLTDSGSRLTRAIWESDAGSIKDPSERFARETFLECCRWVLGMTQA